MRGNANKNPSKGRLLARITRPMAKSDALLPGELAAQSRQRAEQQRAAYRGHGSAPIGVDPVRKDAVAEDREDASEQGPLRRHPALQHPAEDATHHGDAEQHADPGLSRQLLAQGKHQTLRRRIHGLIGRLHVDVEGFKMNPHGWGGLVRRPEAKVSAPSR